MVEQSQEQEREGKEPTTRLNLEIPMRLHTRVKVACAQKGRHMKDEIIAMLEEKFPEHE